MGKDRHRGKKAKRNRNKRRVGSERTAATAPTATSPAGDDAVRSGLTMDHLDAAPTPEQDAAPTTGVAGEAAAPDGDRTPDAATAAEEPTGIKTAEPVPGDRRPFAPTPGSGAAPGPEDESKMSEGLGTRELPAAPGVAPGAVPSPSAEPPGPSPVSRETPAVEALPRPDHTHIFVVANQKGGVGKTTTAVNLVAALAQGGLDVLVVDLDPQGNASTALGVDHHQGTPGSYDVLLNGLPMSDAVVVSDESERLRVLPATIDLAGAEIELVSTVARESKLARALTAYLADHPADFVLLDCPPSLGLLTLNALVAATEILVPIQCEYYALEGVSQLVRTIELVKGELNAGLRLGTVLLTMYDGRTRLAAQVAEEVRTHFAEETLDVVIPRSVRISEAPSYGQTVLSYDPESTGARSYRAAAREIASRSQPQEDER